MQGNIDFLAAPQQSSPFPSFLILILIVGAFYFFLIRPQNKRRREQAQMQNAVGAGARVITTNGMYATVIAVEDDHLVLEIAPGVEARFLKQAIMQVVTEDTGADEETEETEVTEEIEGTEETKDTKDTGIAPAEETAQPKGEADKADEAGKSEGQTPEKPSA